MTTNLPPSFRELPPHVRELPEVREFRLSTVELGLTRVETRLDKVEARPQMPVLDKLPWLQIGGLILLLFLALTGHLSPGEIKTFALKPFGL
jgi:hypothetical protein